MSSPDKPFELRGGESQDTALHNRIAVIKRIEYLTGVDLHTKSTAYLRAFDLEMWIRWYRDAQEDGWKLSEEFCQRAAIVISAMDGKEIKLDEKQYDKAKEEFDARANSKDSGKNAGRPEGQVEDRMREDAPGTGNRPSGEGTGTASSTGQSF